MRLLVILLFLTAFASYSVAQTVNVYSYRQAHLMEPLLQKFKAETGINYLLLTGAAGGLLERLIREGENSPADVLITVDAGNLVAAKVAGVLQPIESEKLKQIIPAHYRDSDNQWFGLSARSRVIFYAPDRIQADAINSYEALANPALGKKICVRSSSNIYNQSLVAAMVAHHGVEATEAWVRGLVANFARQPQDNDTAQIYAVAAGECDVAIANTYYFGRLLSSDKEKDQQTVKAVQMLWPNQDSRGTHMNLSGAGVTKSAKNKDAAIALIEFLASEAAQEVYANENNEFPVNSAVAISGPIKALGTFKADTLPLAELEKHQAEAVKIMDRAGWR
ncbi:Fe(3+) ABC transporter substrate-binding protein [Chrysiogenes arsenatis]|uniref:Fe(3+) ABC transporter substrate-binding protein n=1 Tax=Chrysiogenes arsenatis TaxID=309797 RepID=UPI0004056BEC|nr:Fe(3+) ABC transporter substrate-binding protein [Chrysiogenes arsenatis]